MRRRTFRCGGFEDRPTFSQEENQTFATPPPAAEVSRVDNPTLEGKPNLPLRTFARAVILARNETQNFPLRRFRRVRYLLWRREVRAVDLLTAYGALSVSAMLVFYALEARSAWFVLAFAGACAASALYGFLQGAWPFGVVEAVWCLVALRRWFTRQQRTGSSR